MSARRGVPIAARGEAGERADERSPDPVVDCGVDRVLHTILGPDHYVVFTAMARARWGWRRRWVTLACGTGHHEPVIPAASVSCRRAACFTRRDRGARQPGRLRLAGLRPDVPGLGSEESRARPRHSHVHVHDDVVTITNTTTAITSRARACPHSITPWAMFIIFVLGPCEALIPLFMYPAAQQSGTRHRGGAVFGIVTLLPCCAVFVTRSARKNCCRSAGSMRSPAASVAAADAISIIGL